MPHLSRLLFATAILICSGALKAAQQNATPIDPEMACLAKCTTKGPFGSSQLDRDCVKRCLTPPVPPATAPVRFTPAWERSTNQRQKRVIEDLIQQILRKSRATRLFTAALALVELDRNDAPACIPIHVRPGTLTFDRCFFPDDINHQDLILFELGKAVWLHADATRGRAASRHLLALTVQNPTVFRSLKHAKHDGRNLRTVADPDNASALGYAFRALVLGLESPAEPPDGYTPSEWSAIQTRWAKLRPDLENVLHLVLIP